MNIFKKVTPWILMALLSSSYIQANQTITYQNQRGSTMTLTWLGDPDKTGTLTGSFISAVGSVASKGIAQPITGFYNGNAVGITVNFVNAKQVVAMTGNLTNNNAELHTLWLDANQATDPTRQDWNSTLIGADHYTKVLPVKQN